MPDACYAILMLDFDRPLRELLSGRAIDVLGGLDEEGFRELMDAVSDELLNDEQLLERFLCLDCDDDTLDSGEYYMVLPSIWKGVTDEDERDGMLCVGCLEERLGRTLTADDFTGCPLNASSAGSRSARLAARMAP